jgi:glutaredoxin
MHRIIILSRVGCLQCKASSDYLKNRGVVHEYWDIVQDKQAAPYLALVPHVKSLPIVFVEDQADDSYITEYWTGFQPDRLAALVNL